MVDLEVPAADIVVEVDIVVAVAHAVLEVVDLVADSHQDAGDAIDRHPVSKEITLHDCNLLEASFVLTARDDLTLQQKRCELHYRTQ